MEEVHQVHPHQVHLLEEEEVHQEVLEVLEVHQEEVKEEQEHHVHLHLLQVHPQLLDQVQLQLELMFNQLQLHQLQTIHQSTLLIH